MRMFLSVSDHRLRQFAAQVTQSCGKVPARHASGTKRKTIMEQKRHDLL